MNPIGPNSNHSLRFSGVQTHVLNQLEAKRASFKKDSDILFGERVDVFVKQDPHAGGIVEVVANQPDAKSLPYVSGAIRAMNRMLTGEDIKPETKLSAHQAPHQGDSFRRESLN
jgi:hypothetical protein